MARYPRRNPGIYAPEPYREAPPPPPPPRLPQDPYATAGAGEMDWGAGLLPRHVNGRPPKEGGQYMPSAPRCTYPPQTGCAHGKCRASRARSRDTPATASDELSRGGVSDQALGKPPPRLPTERNEMTTAKQKASRAKFAAKARSGRGKVGKAAKSTAAPKKKRKGK